MFPRVLDIDATGVVVACPGGELEIGTRVAATMGGLGRAFDGSYTEYTCVPFRQVGRAGFVGGHGPDAAASMKPLPYEGSGLGLEESGIHSGHLGE